MKGRTGSTGVETRHEVPGQLEEAEPWRDGRSFSGRHSPFRRWLRPGRLVVAIAGLAIAFLIGVFSINYGSKLFESWRERRLLHQATALLQEGNLSKAAQIARELARRHPDSLAALSILADTAETIVAVSEP